MKKYKKFFPSSIVVTVKNESQTIKDLLNSIENQTVFPAEVVIVDAGSTDKTVEIIKESMKKNKKIKLIIRRGISIAGGRNLGVLNSNSNIVAMTDAGCKIGKNWLLNITKPFLISPKIGIVAGMYKMSGKSLFQKAVKPYLGVLQKLAVSSNFLPSARSIAFRKSTWKKIGGFSEKLELAGEDTLFNYIAKKKGINFYYAKNAIVCWEVSGSIVGSFKKFYLYAKGDAQTGIWWHPEMKLKTHNLKILSIYFRYVLGLFLLLLSLFWFIFFKIFLSFFLFYVLWSILKNYHRVEKKLALILSPFVQILSDIAVMAGFADGIFSRK